MHKFNKAFVVTLICAGITLPAVGSELITNGSFESGDLTSWTKSVENGSNGDIYVVQNNGGNSPVSAFPYAVNSNGGNYFAMTDQHGVGSYALTQSFTADGTSDIGVKFQLFANNQAGPTSITPPDRDFNTVPNQNVVVDILNGGADAFTTNTGDIVATLYGPTTDGSGANPWVSYAFNLGVLAAGAYQFRFAETDNQLFLQAGIDNIEVSTSSTNVPEPTSIALLSLGLLGLAAGRRERI